MSGTTNGTAKEAILSVRGLKVYFPIHSGSMFKKPVPLKAVDDVSFDLFAGETLGIVGESGCGKSTLGRGVLQLLKPTGGEVIWLGKHLEGLSSKEMIDYRRELQIIFQDPLASLDPRMTIGNIIAEPLTVHYPELSKNQKKEKVREMMECVGLLPLMINRYPHEFSGGQCQRIGVARTMILKPKHPYTQALISAVPIPDPDLEKEKQRTVLEGDLPSPINPPSGCVFRTRCPLAQPICAEEKPQLIDTGDNHQVACHFSG